MKLLTWLLVAVMMSVAQAQSPLEGLKPLPKKHYPFGVPVSWLRAPDEDLKGVFRVCGGSGIQVQFLTEESLKRTVDLSKEVGVPMMVQFSPWSKDRVPNNEPAHMYGEVAFFASRCSMIKATGIDVPAVSIDDERYDLGNAEEMMPWRTALYRVAKTYFPNATVEWYAHGSVRPAATDTGWSEPAFTLGKDLPTDLYATSLYRPGELEVQRMTIRKSVAALPEGKKLVVYLALGAGYKPQWEAFHKWVDPWDYEPLLDKIFSREMAVSWYWQRPERAFPGDKIAYVVLYPPPAKGSWFTHFVAYAQGAQP